MLRNILIIVLLLNIFSCANVKPLTGGEKDITSPKILEAYPENYSTSINPQQIQILFSEKIADNNSEQNIIITPTIDLQIKTKVKKDKLVINFDKIFAENTTYTIYLDKTVKDLTESNESKNTKYVFSTSSFLDSASVKVEAISKRNQKPMVKALVSLYNSNDTLTLKNNKPLYFAYTDSKGVAELSNIKPGSYNVYALDDKNGNLKYDNTEPIAFIENTITIDSNKRTVKLHPLFIDIENNLKLKTVLKYDNTYRLIFNKMIETISFIDTLNNEYNPTYWFTDNYNINVVNFDTTTPYKIICNTTDNQIDTLDIELRSAKAIKYLDLQLINSNIKPLENIKLKLSNKPFLIVDSLMYFYADTNKVSNIGWKLDSTHNILEIFVPKLLNTFKLQMDSGAIQNNNIASKEITKTIEVVQEMESGSISGSVNCKYPFIVQLLDTQYNIIEEQFNESEYKFKYIKPGTYQIRLIIDKNKNGIWDDSNYEKLTESENIVFHNAKIILKKNWEIKEIDLNY